MATILGPLPPANFAWTDEEGRPTATFAQYMFQLDQFVRSLMAGTYAGNLAVTGAITATNGIIAGLGGADQVGLQTHKHGGVTTGAGSTAVPTAGT